MTSQPIIELAHVSKIYSKDRRPINALQSVNLTIGRGEFVAVTGPSGGGKSTLLQIIGGLDRPSEGTVRVEGVDLAEMSDSQLAVFRNKRLGFVFQDPALLPFLSVSQNMRLPAMFGGLVDQNARVEELAAIVGLEDRLNHLPRELSGGQAQRCAVARALFNKPIIVCADEPTGNLDATNANTILELFRQIRSELGTTIVMVTHDLQLASKADRVLQIENGLLQ